MALGAAMSKLADALREQFKIFNTHGLLSKFGDKDRDIAVSYTAPDQRSVMANGSAVWSPSFKTDPQSAWYDHGKRTFVGNRAESMPRALKWATETYGITDWAPCPFGGAKVPKYVLDRAKAAVKGHVAQAHSHIARSK